MEKGERGLGVRLKGVLSEDKKKTKRVPPLVWRKRDGKNVSC